VSTLNLFDSSLGMLTDVELMIIGAMTTNITLSNRAAQSQTVKADSSVNLFFTSTLAPLNGAFAAPAFGADVHHRLCRPRGWCWPGVWSAG